MDFRKTLRIAMVCCTIAAPIAGYTQDANPKPSETNSFGEATKEMTDSMMSMMGGMLKMWTEASRPVWQSTSQMFGEYGDWCISCHVEMESIYDQMGETLNKGIHKNLTDEALAKALDAYNKLRGSE